MRQLLRKAWLRPLVVGMSLFLGFSGGSWVTMHWLSTSIQRRIETLAMENLRIEDARGMLAEIEETTWGVTLTGGQRGAIRDAAGRHDGPSVLQRGRAALREAVERVRELYDRLGTTADGGLGEVVRAVREGIAAALRASRSLAATGRDLAAAGRAAERSERSLAGAGRAARRASGKLDRLLWDARREVARPLDLTRPRGPERDHGPSR